MTKNKIFNTTLAASMLAGAGMGVAPVFAAPGDVPADTVTKTVTINNIQGAQEVTAYRIVKPTYNSEGFVRFTKAANVTMADIEHPTANEVTTIAQGILNGQIVPDKTVVMSGTGTTYTADLPAGEYVVLVKNADEAKFIYNPMVVSTYYTDANEADSIVSAPALNAETPVANFYAKKTTILLDKEITDADGQTIKDDDSEDGSQADDLAVGDTAKFTIRTQIPAYSDAYKANGVEFKLEDTQDAGFDAPFDIVVNVGGMVVNAGAATFNQQINGNDFTLDFASAFALSHAGQNVVVTYKAKLNSSAVQKFSANKNTAKLTFTNDVRQTKASLQDDVSEYTFPVQVKKVNEDAEPIAGAEFTLTRLEADGKTGLTAPVTITTDGNGIAQFDRLDEGTYQVQETKAPAGYAINPNIFKITITPTYNTDGTLNKYVVNMVDTSNGNAPVGNITVDNADADILAGNITDSKLQVLPSTGGQGTKVAIIIASALAGVTVGLVAYGKKKEQAE